MSGLVAKEEANEALKQEALQAVAYQMERDRKEQKEEARCLADEKELTEFLRSIVNGEQDKAEAMLKARPTLALKKGVVRDPSGREFKKITGFQYAAWGLDWHMWRMLLKYLPKEEAALQFAELEEKGTAHGNQFSLAPLLEALNTYVKNYASWSLNQCEAYWCRAVGGNQLLLPVSVVNEYCHVSRSFVPVPTFEEAELRRSIETALGSWYTSEYNGGQLGKTFGYCRYDWEQTDDLGSAAMYCVDTDIEARGDAGALQSLSKKRELQLQALRTELSSVKQLGMKN